MDKTGFRKTLDQVDKLMRQANVKVTSTKMAYGSGDVHAAYNQAMKLEQLMEKLVLLTRTLPAYTGNPMASVDVERVIKDTVPVKVGFTEQGWFSIRMPSILPKKTGGSTEYLRGILYPVLWDFFKFKQPIRYPECVLIYRHVYAKDRPERRYRDHDNIELNTVTDIVAMYTMPDDNPNVCDHYYCSAVGSEERTEVYVVPRGEFFLWLIAAQGMPDEGVKLYDSLPK